MNKQIPYKLNNFFIILIFCSAIFIPFVTSIFESNKEISFEEKRTLKQAPEMPQQIDDIKKFPELFEAYYLDHFGLREWFTRYYKLLKYKLGDSASENVTIGKNGYLFLGSIKNTKFQSEINNARNANLYSEKQLMNVARQMTALNVWLNEQGIEYVFVIAPNKSTIYFDQLPNYISRVNDKSATDQLFGYLREHTNVTVVDLRPRLIEEKEKYPLYYKTGTHWNFRGGNIAQYEIMRVIEKMFPGKISPELYSDDIFEFDVATDKVLEEQVGMNPEQPSYAPYPVFKPNMKKIRDYPPKIANLEELKNLKKAIRTNVNADEKLNVVTFGDSFFIVLEPYFNRKFKHVTYMVGKVNYPSLKKCIDLEKPDIVIEEWVERNLPYVPKTIKEFNTY
jgi:hypothetical protein